jgi:hypothetical protein
VKKIGFMRKIQGVGFNGIVDITWEGVFQARMIVKLSVGKLW